MGSSLLLAIATAAAGGEGWPGALFGMAMVWVIFFVLSLLPGGGMGWGDVRLSVSVGLLLGWLGWRPLQTGLLSIVLLGGLGAVLVMIRGRSRKADFAYGPALCLGVFGGILWASQIMAT